MLQVQLLGSFQITENGEPISGLTRPRLHALIAYLLLHTQYPLSRAQIAYTFWPESTDVQARTNLRRELHQLRQCFPQADNLWRLDSQSIEQTKDAPITLDVAVFEHALAQASDATSSEENLEFMLAAIDAYPGDLLPHLYDEWILQRREYLRQKYIRALDESVSLLVGQREYTTAGELARRLLKEDPLNESAYRQLIVLYEQQDDRAHALHTYHECAAVLERELGVSPSAETQALYEELLRSDGHNEPVQSTVAQQTQLVGRKPEWETLLSAWQRAKRGRAHLVLIAGEAGIGKSRIAEELLGWANRQGGLTARTRSYAAEGSLAYAPLVEWLRSSALRTRLKSVGDVWLSEVSRLLPELLSERPDLPPPEPLADSWQRQRLFEALARAVTVDDQPMLLLIDDLQWCDQETLEWLRYLLHFDPLSPLLLLGTVREEEVAREHPLHALLQELRHADQLTEVELSPLDPEETAMLASGMSARPMDGAAMARIFAATDGNPLFVVETVRAGESGQQIAAEDKYQDGLRLPSSDLYLPPKVYAVIQARLSQLSPQAYALAEQAAAIGRDFSLQLLVAASDQDEDTVVRSLDELWRLRIMRDQRLNRYDFSHDRIRDVAYAEVGPLRIRSLHRRVADALEGLHAADLSTVSGQLALHCERAGNADSAITWHHRAEKADQKLLAYPNAELHVRAALALIDSSPATSRDLSTCVDLLLDLDMCIYSRHGVVHGEREILLRRARTLAAQIDDRRQLLVALKRLSFFHSGIGDQHSAGTVAEEFSLVAEQTTDLKQSAQAHFVSSLVHIRVGNFDLAMQLLEQGLAWLTEAAEDDEETTRLSANHSMILAVMYSLTGYADRALLHAKRYPERRKILGLRALVGYAFFTAIVYRTIGSDRLLAESVDVDVELGEQYDMQLPRDTGRVFRGWILAQQGDVAAGIALTQHGVDNYRKIGQIMYQTLRLGILAEMHLMAHQLDQAQEVIEEALDISDRFDERFWDVELYRLRGDLLLARGSEPGAEASYRRAIEVAKDQGARFLELRALIALCRLWQRQGKTDVALQQLSELYGWYTEGFDTPDLRDAKELLDQLHCS